MALSKAKKVLDRRGDNDNSNDGGAAISQE